VGAFAAGEIFVRNGQPGASLAMGILTGVALLCYVGTLALASAAQRQVMRPPSHPAAALPAKYPGSWFVRGVKQDPAGLRPGAATGGRITPRLPGLRVFATVVWALAAAALIALTVAWGVHWVRYPERARGHANNPVMAQFWGAPPMALMTVGTGTLLLGPGLIGSGAALGADWVLWLAGTALGLVTAAATPQPAG
jgi:hypothetical protein